MRATMDDPEGRAKVEAAIADQAEHFDTFGLQLGYRYAEGALLPDGEAPPEPKNPVTDFVPTGAPGARVPHAWVARNGARVSTLDLLWPQGFTLLTTEPSPQWEVAARSVAGAPVRAVAVGSATLEDAARWRDEAGIGDGGALLVRPDQHVAWRAKTLPANPTAALRDALARILGTH